MICRWKQEACRLEGRYSKEKKGKLDDEREGRTRTAQRETVEGQLLDECASALGEATRTLNTSRDQRRGAREVKGLEMES